MMTLANYGIGSSKHRDPNSTKVLSKSLQIRNRAELALKQHLKSHFKVSNDKRVEILNSLGDYYSRIPFNAVIWNKYQTKQCIIDSILLLDSKFNPYRAREAFRLVEQMLINLVYTPWHKEFRQIHTYSGKFRLSVSGPLIGVEEVLKSAGYQEAPESVMHLILPEARMPQTDDGESVTSVIFDCMLAQVVLTNIIEIFENCCKGAKAADRDNYSDINCYNWIQAYFRERSHQTTDRACSSIQELLNNIANYLSRSSPSRVPYQSELLVDGSLERLNSIKPIDSRLSPKTSARERTREFSIQQSNEDEKLSAISNDLLRLPDICKRAATVFNKHGDANNEINMYRPNTVRPNIHGDPYKTQILPDNGYNVNHRVQQVSNDRMTPSGPVEYRDTVDRSYPIRNGTSSGASLYRNSNDSVGHLTVDLDHVPHSDREPLLPKYNRRVPLHNQVPVEPARRNSLYDNDFVDARAHTSRSEGLLGTRRDNYEDQFYNHGPSSHAQISSISNHQLRGPNVTSKYSNNIDMNNSSYRKYESRDTDRGKLVSSRSYWSCGSCTFNNQINSETCEICRNRRPSR